MHGFDFSIEVAHDIISDLFVHVNSERFLTWNLINANCTRHSRYPTAESYNRRRKQLALVVLIEGTPWFECHVTKTKMEIRRWGVFGFSERHGFSTNPRQTRATSYVFVAKRRFRLLSTPMCRAQRGTKAVNVLRAWVFENIQFQPKDMRSAWHQWKSPSGRGLAQRVAEPTWISREEKQGKGGIDDTRYAGETGGRLLRICWHLSTFLYRSVTCVHEPAGKRLLWLVWFQSLWKSQLAPKLLHLFDSDDLSDTEAVLITRFKSEHKTCQENCCRPKPTQASCCSWKAYVGGTHRTRWLFATLPHHATSNNFFDVRCMRASKTNRTCSIVDN